MAQWAWLCQDAVESQITWIGNTHTHTHTHTHSRVQWCLCKWGLCEYDLYGSLLWRPWEQMSLAFFQLCLSLSFSFCSECKVNTRWRDSVLCSNSNCSSQWTLTCDLQGWFLHLFTSFFSSSSQRKQKSFLTFNSLFSNTVQAHCLRVWF